MSKHFISNRLKIFFILFIYFVSSGEPAGPKPLQDSVLVFTSWWEKTEDPSILKKKKRLRRLMRSKSDSSTDMKHFPVPQHTHVDLLKWALLSWFHVFSCLLCKTSWKLQHNFNVIITWLVCQFLDAFYNEGSTRQRFLYMYSLHSVCMCRVSAWQEQCLPAVFVLLTLLSTWRLEDFRLILWCLVVTPPVSYSVFSCVSGSFVMWT